MLPPINELLAFQKVASLLSFNKAAEELSLTPSTLSHLIRGLEERLQTRLFNRTTRSVSLTDSGQKLFPRLNILLNELEQEFDNLNDENTQPQGTARISVGEPVAPILLDRIHSKLKKKFPNIQTEFIVDNRPIDIVSAGLDAGVRFKHIIPKDMVAIPIIENFRFVTVASKSYIKANGRPIKPNDLLNHNCIGFRFQSGRLYEWKFKKREKEISLNVKGTITTNNSSLMLDAVKKGIGIGHIAEPLINKELLSGELVLLLNDWTPEKQSLYLYYPRNRHTPSALKAIISILQEKD